MMHRKLSQQELYRLRDRAIGATNISVLIADAREPDHPLNDINPAFERLTGYSAAEAIGRNCRFLQGPQTDPAVRDQLRSALAANREISTVILNYRKDGTPFWNEIHVSPVYSADGALTHFVGVQRDVTVGTQAEESRQLLTDASAIFSGSLHPEETVTSLTRLVVPRFADRCSVHLVDEKGDIRLVANAPAAAAKDWHEAHNTPLTGDHASVLTGVLRSATSVHQQQVKDSFLHEIAINDDHRQRLATLSVASFMMVPIASSGRVFGTLSFAQTDSGRTFTEHDLSLAEDLGRRLGAVFEIARLYAQSQRAIAARDQFLSIAAHELRTPVVSIKGYAQLLLRGLGGNTLQHQRLERALQTINTSVSRLSILTNDLLDVARHGLGEVPLRLEPVLIHAYLETFLHRHEADLLQGRSYQLAQMAEDRWLAIDVGRVDQVLTNLIDNAVKYSEPDEPILIRLDDERNGVTLTVSDSGIGLSPDETTSIFEPFGRTARAIRDQVPGIGLGLFISRSIIERHGGQIWAESDGRGKGTRLRVWLPTVPAPDAPENHLGGTPP